MATKVMGGGSSAVAASSHAACERFRGTDPLVTGLTRRKLARAVGFADDSGRIPEARWMRAMTFERLVRDVRFASKVATTTVGALGLSRPSEVVTVNAHVDAGTTARLLQEAHARAVGGRAATLVHQLAVPFVGYEETDATPVLPDFAVVAPTVDGAGSWLVMGDAKDYERVRSKIDDGRLLKGFLQVALGAESAAAWTRLPDTMSVHDYGVLAVPRNAFLQPEALIERLDDHRAEVRMRVAERRSEADARPYDRARPLPQFVAHLDATFDPASCTTCNLFSYCRGELRHSADPTDLLVEIGVPLDQRPQLMGLIDGTGVVGQAPASTVANVTASRDGVACSTHQRRVDQAGVPGTVNVVLAKSDAAALGVHGMALQRVTAEGREPWQFTVFDDPQSVATRRSVMRLVGRQLTTAMTEQRKQNADEPSPIHLVVPDKPTADVLVSIADNLAGVELSRLRWQQDKRMGREALTFDGEPAQMPKALSESDRTAVSLLLEEDRARALTIRCPVVDVRAVLARHVTAGGPAVSSYRLDYLLGWAQSTDAKPLDHRRFADDIEASEQTPGARLTSRRSDDIHRALAGTRSSRRRSKDGSERPVDPQVYADLVIDELEYKCSVLEGALDALEGVPDSALREVHRAIEGDAQAVWRRRLALHASDLVRFGRTYRTWRNSLVRTIESDATCRAQLLALANPQAAEDLAADAGNRHVAFATVVDTHPLILDVESRRIGDGNRVVLLHSDNSGVACIEADTVTCKAQKGSFKLGGLSLGPLAARKGTPRRFVWSPGTPPSLEVGDRVVVADVTWFTKNKGNNFLNFDRPTPDTYSAPNPTCTAQSYAEDPVRHRWCCRPHEVAEAEWSDELAARRDRGELNPQTWPPVRDGDAFEVAAKDAPVGDVAAPPSQAPPDGLTMDDLD
ncbi:MAG TPA: hypothetical protein VFJ19_01425 [Nocardioidaceae bacterium]|nr:hypothetical protein [Nocardioidaceae bacterium]